MEQPVKTEQRISYSQYVLWSQCPKSWELKYIRGHREKEQSIYLLFGKALHECIQEYLIRRYNGTDKFFDVNGLLKDRLFENFKLDTVEVDGVKQYPTDKKTLLEFFEDGKAILSHFLVEVKTLYPVKGMEILGVEIPLEVMLTETVKYVGFLDIVLRDKKSGAIYIHDFKTSTRGWFKERNDPLKLHQVLLYKRYYSEQYGVEEENIFVSFIILKRKINEKSEWAIAKRRVNVIEPAQGKIATKKAVKALEAFHTSVYDENGNPTVDDIRPTPSAKNCKYCAFRERKDLCPDGV